MIAPVQLPSLPGFEPLDPFVAAWTTFWSQFGFRYLIPAESREQTAERLERRTSVHSIPDEIGVIDRDGPSHWRVAGQRIMDPLA